MYSGLSISSAGSIIVRIAYGYETREKDDPIIALADAAMRHFKRLRDPGTYMVDFIPLRTRTLPFSASGVILTSIHSETRPSLVSRSGFQENCIGCKEVTS